MAVLRLNRLAQWFVVLMLLALAIDGWILLHVFRLHVKSLQAQENRQQSLNLAYDIQQETAALSRMVRAYTTSANTKYLNYYYDIIDIRLGKKAAPAGYSPTYWSEVIAGERVHVLPAGVAGDSLLERMKRHGFSKEDFSAIDRVLDSSEMLHQQDQIAFAATQGLYDPNKKKFIDDGEPQRDFANQFVYSEAYLKLENTLNKEVEAFVTLTERRTRVAVEQVTGQLQQSIVVAILLLVGTVIAALIAAGIIRKMVLAPMKNLMDNASAIGSGEYAVRADIQRGVHEIQALGHTFNLMAGNIEEDIQQREQIQHQLEIANAQAEEATRTKSLFLANMSHEIRTPMNAIIGMTYLAMNSGLDGRQRDYIGNIQKASQSLLGIINDILDFSKIEAGKMVLEAVAFQVEEVLTNALTLLRQRALEKGIELLLEIKSPQLLGESGTFLGDPLRIGQILTNLLSNAVKFTGTGYVKLCAERRPHDQEQEELLFLVEDTGIGMSAEQQACLFQEFSQVDGSTTRKFGGTGLGLSISKKLVTLMDGQLSVTSEPGKGSRFHCTLTLPAAAREGYVPEMAAPGTRALIIDDHEPARSVLGSLLSHFGVTSVGVPSGAMALELLQQPGVLFDLIFIDRVMPDMDGDAVLAAIRGLPLVNDPRCVLISAYDIDKSTLADDLRDPVPLLPKPILPGDIRQLLHERQHPTVADPVRQTSARAARVRGMRVLLVEDNAVNQQVATELLHLVEVQVDIANNGKEAIDRLDAHPADYYQAVLMDIQMPVMDGFESTAILRRQDRYRDLPIIAMTAHAMVEEQQRCRAAGMNAHVAKPIHPENLYEVLSKYGTGPAGPQVLQEPAKTKVPLTVPGIDAETGLSYCADRVEIYHKTLRGYLRMYTGFADQMQTLLQDEQWEEMFNRSHSFKSLSGTIGAKQLFELGQQLESHSKARSQEIVPLIVHLNTSLDPVIVGLQRYFSDQKQGDGG